MARIGRELPERSPAHRKVAEFVLAHPFRAATMNIDELAAAAEVSVATANRFARALGFAGYPQFRAELLRVFESSFAPVEKLRAELDRSASHAQVIAESLELAATNVQCTLQRLAPEVCERAVELILTARKVLVVGFGISAVHARFVAETLEPYCTMVQEITGFGGPERCMRKVMHLGCEDLVIGITLPRYSRQTVDFLRQAQERGARLLALTDAPSSPITPLADAALFAVAEHRVLHGSSAALIALIEGLGAALARTARGTVDEATELTERILPYLYIDEPAAARARRRHDD